MKNYPTWLRDEKGRICRKSQNFPTENGKTARETMKVYIKRKWLVGERKLEGIALEK